MLTKHEIQTLWKPLIGTNKVRGYKDRNFEKVTEEFIVEVVKVAKLNKSSEVPVALFIYILAKHILHNIFDVK